MALSKIDLISLVNGAYYTKRRESEDTYQNTTAKLLADGYYGVRAWGDGEAYRRGMYNDPTKEAANEAKVYNAMFDFVKRVFVFCVTLDTQLDRGEYGLYQKFCRACERAPESSDEITRYAISFSVKEYVKYVDYLAHIRDEFPTTTSYHNMVLGFVYLAIYCEGRFTKLAYDIIKRFLKSGLDNCPPYDALMREVYE